MAFFGRLGSILRQSASKQITSQVRSSPSVFQAIRCMTTATPTTKLFIGGVSYSTDEQSLREAFSRYGQVLDARIISDRETGRSRGFGFVTFSSVEEASSAIQALDGQDLHGRVIRVNYANERPRGFGGGGFGGGYGNAPYGGAAGGGYGGSYGGGSSGGGYDGGSYGGGGYGGGSYGGSGAGSNYTAPGGGYGNDGNFTSGNTHTGGGYGGNNVNYGDAGGIGNHESSAGFAGSDDVVNAGAGGGNPGFASTGYDGSGTGIGSGNLYGGSRDSGDSLEGNFRDDDDDTDNFAKRA